MEYERKCGKCQLEISANFPNSSGIYIPSLIWQLETNYKYQKASLLIKDIRIDFRHFYDVPPYIIDKTKSLTHQWVCQVCMGQLLFEVKKYSDIRHRPDEFTEKYKSEAFTQIVKSNMNNCAVKMQGMFANINTQTQKIAQNPETNHETLLKLSEIFPYDIALNSNTPILIHKINQRLLFRYIYNNIAWPLYAVENPSFAEEVEVLVIKDDVNHYIKNEKKVKSEIVRISLWPIVTEIFSKESQYNPNVESIIPGTSAQSALPALKRLFLGDTKPGVERKAMWNKVRQYFRFLTNTESGYKFYAAILKLISYDKAVIINGLDIAIDNKMVDRPRLDIYHSLHRDLKKVAEAKNSPRKPKKIKDEV